MIRIIKLSHFTERKTWWRDFKKPCQNCHLSSVIFWSKITSVFCFVFVVCCFCFFFLMSPHTLLHYVHISVWYLETSSLNHEPGLTGTTCSTLAAPLYFSVPIPVADVAQPAPFTPSSACKEREMGQRCPWFLMWWDFHLNHRCRVVLFNKLLHKFHMSLQGGCSLYMKTEVSDFTNDTQYDT